MFNRVTLLTNASGGTVIELIEWETLFQRTQVAHRLVEVTVIHDNQGGLASKLKRHAFQVGLGSGRHDQPVDSDIL